MIPDSDAVAHRKVDNHALPKYCDDFLAAHEIGHCVFLLLYDQSHRKSGAVALPNAVYCTAEGRDTQWKKKIQKRD